MVIRPRLRTPRHQRLPAPQTSSGSLEQDASVGAYRISLRATVRHFLRGFSCHKHSCASHSEQSYSTTVIVFIARSKVNIGSMGQGLLSSNQEGECTTCPVNLVRSDEHFSLKVCCDFTNNCHPTPYILSPLLRFSISVCSNPSVCVLYVGLSC